MIDVLIAGVVSGTPHGRILGDGRARVKLGLLAHDGRGDPQHIVATATNPVIRAHLIRLREGESIAIAGHASFDGCRGESSRAPTMRVLVTRVISTRDDSPDDHYDLD